jgi:murein L,D-transpeptidase YafK
LSVASSRQSLSGSVDLVVVTKHLHRLSLLAHGKELARYQVSLGRSPVGQKTCEGDDRTPEGVYVLDRLNRSSKYHLAFHVSYPNASDRARAARARCSPGGDIMIHGIRQGFGWLGVFQRFINWTHGCIAVSNGEIEQIAQNVRPGTRVRIDP